MKCTTAHPHPPALIPIAQARVRIRVQAPVQARIRTRTRTLGQAVRIRRGQETEIANGGSLHGRVLRGIRMGVQRYLEAGDDGWVLGLRLAACGSI